MIVPIVALLLTLAAPAWPTEAMVCSDAIPLGSRVHVADPRSRIIGRYVLILTLPVSRPVGIYYETSGAGEYFSQSRAQPLQSISGSRELLNSWKTNFEKIASSQLIHSTAHVALELKPCTEK